MQQLQFSESQLAEAEKMQRTFSGQEWDTIDQGFFKLVEQGLTYSPDNYMTIVRTYNDNPNVKITVDEIVSMVTADNNRQYFSWLSAEQIEYNGLQAELGQEQSDLLHRLLPRHGLVDNQTNFSLLGQFHSKNHWPITASTFQRAIDAVRFTPQGYRLVWAPTPDEINARKEAKEARERADAAPRRTPLEVAQAKADAVRGVKNWQTGRLLSDEIMQQYYDEHPIEEAPAAPAKASDDVNPDNSYWQRRTMQYIQSLQGKLLRDEATEKFGKQAINAYWKVNYLNLDSWITRRKSGGKD